MLQIEINILLIGIISSPYGMMVGAGGGFIIVPALLLVLKMPPEPAAGTGLVIVVLNTLSGVFGFIKQRRVNYEYALYLTYGAIPGSLAGVWFAWIVSTDFFYIIFATLLIGMGILLIIKKTANNRVLTWILLEMKQRTTGRLEYNLLHSVFSWVH